MQVEHDWSLSCVEGSIAFAAQPNGNSDVLWIISAVTADTIVDSLQSSILVSVMHLLHPRDDIGAQSPVPFRPS